MFVRCRYLAVASKGWYGYGLSRSGRARDKSPPSTPVAFFTFMMFLAPVTNWEPRGVTLAGYCYPMRHGMKNKIITPYRFSHLRRYGVMVRGKVTSVYPHLEVNLRLQPFNSYGKSTQYPPNEILGGLPQSVGMYCRRERSSVPPVTRTSDRPAHSLVTTGNFPL
jgi:hypothetical protein